MFSPAIFPAGLDGGANGSFHRVQIDHGPARLTPLRRLVADADNFRVPGPLPRGRSGATLVEPSIQGGDQAGTGFYGRGVFLLHTALDLNAIRYSGRILDAGFRTCARRRFRRSSDRAIAVQDTNVPFQNTVPSLVVGQAPPGAPGVDFRQANIDVVDSLTFQRRSPTRTAALTMAARCGSALMSAIRSAACFGALARQYRQIGEGVSNPDRRSPRPADRSAGSGVLCAKGQGFAFLDRTRTVFGNNRSTEAAITQGRDSISPGLPAGRTRKAARRVPRAGPSINRPARSGLDRRPERPRRGNRYRRRFPTTNPSIPATALSIQPVRSRRQNPAPTTAATTRPARPIPLHLSKAARPVFASARI